MGMVGAGVDLELPELLRPEARVREHALDRASDGFLGTPLEEVAEALLLETLGKPAVADVGLRVLLRDPRKRRYTRHAGVKPRKAAPWPPGGPTVPAAAFICVIVEI